MSTDKHPIETAIAVLLDSLPDQEALDIIGNILHDREVPYVLWVHEDFLAEIKENWADTIPKNLWHQIAAKALEQAREPLSDTRNNDLITEAIDGVWSDAELTRIREDVERAERATWVNFKVRFRNPENRNEVEAQYVLAKDADAAVARIIGSFPRYNGWGVASVRIVK